MNKIMVNALHALFDDGVDDYDQLPIQIKSQLAGLYFDKVCSFDEKLDFIRNASETILTHTFDRAILTLLKPNAENNGELGACFASLICVEVEFSVKQLFIDEHHKYKLNQTNELNNSRHYEYDSERDCEVRHVH